MLSFIAKITAGVVIVAGAFLGGFLTHQSAPTAGNFNPTGGGTYLLQSSISASQTTITLTSFEEPGSNIPYTMSYLNSSIEYATIAPSSGSSEFISFTGIVQNANGTATLSGILRGLSRTPGTGGCVASSTLARAFPGQTQFILSNSPCFYSQYAVKQNNEGIAGVWDFYSLPTSTTTATTAFQLVNKATLDAATNQGAATSTETNGGIVELATAAEQAASFYGGVAKPTVLQSRYASSTPSTPQSVSALTTIVSGATGYIAQAWIDFTANFNFTGTTRIQNLNASSTSANPLVFNGLSYNMPSVRAGTSTVLSEDGSGGLTWELNRGLKYVFATTTAITQTAGVWATSTSMTIPAGVLTSSSTIQVEGSVTFTNDGTGGNACPFTVSYATTGAPFFSTSQNPGTSVTTNLDFSFTIFATSSLSTQASLGSYHSNTAAVDSFIKQITNFNFANAVPIVAALTCGAGNSHNSATLNYLDVIATP